MLISLSSPAQLSRTPEVNETRKLLQLGSGPRLPGTVGPIQHAPALNTSGKQLKSKITGEKLKPTAGSYIAILQDVLLIDRSPHHHGFFALVSLSELGGVHSN